MVREGSASSLFDQGLSIFVVRGSCTRNRLDQELAISFGPPSQPDLLGRAELGGKAPAQWHAWAIANPVFQGMTH